MSEKVFLLGSGFSLAVNEIMPTLAGLSEAALDELKQSDVPLPPGHGTPVAADFERWMTYLVDSPPWLDDADQLRNQGSFFDLAKAVHSALMGRQLRVVASSPPQWLLDLVAYWNRHTSTVITFNYDLLVELAWLHIAKHDDPVSTQLYAVPLTPANARAQAVLAGDRPATMTLLKLHGSLNWYYSGLSANAGEPILELPVRGSWGREAVLEADDFFVADREPLIIPPAATKTPYYRNRTLRAQWHASADAIRAADEIVIMGYGFPPTDLIVSSMLASLVRPNQTIVLVTNDRKLEVSVRKLLEPTSPVDASSQVVSWVPNDRKPIPWWVEQHCQPLEEPDAS